MPATLKATLPMQGGKVIEVSTAGCTAMNQLVKLVCAEAKIDEKAIFDYAFIYAQSNLEVFVVDFTYWTNSLKGCDLTLVHQEK